MAWSVSDIGKSVSDTFKRVASPVTDAVGRVEDLFDTQAPARDLSDVYTPFDDSLTQALARLSQTRQGLASSPTFTQQAVAAPGQIDPATVAAVQAISAGPRSQYETDQRALVDLLTRQATGQGGPSPAELQLMAAQDANTRQAMALAGSISGRGLPVSQRQLLQQAALGGQQTAQQAAILRAQETLKSQEALAQAINQARTGDLTFGQQQLDAAKSNQYTDLQSALANQKALQDARVLASEQAYKAAQFNAEQDLLRQKLQDEALRARLDTDARLAQTSYMTQADAALAKMNAQLERDALISGAKQVAQSQRLKSLGAGVEGLFEGLASSKAQDGGNGAGAGTSGSGG